MHFLSPTIHLTWCIIGCWFSLASWGLVKDPVNPPISPSIVHITNSSEVLKLLHYLGKHHFGFCSWMRPLWPIHLFFLTRYTSLLTHPTTLFSSLKLKVWPTIIIAPTPFNAPTIEDNLNKHKIFNAMLP